MGRLKSKPLFEKLSEVLEQLDYIPPERIRMQPPPGMATEEDVVQSKKRFNCICELVDRTLVEKPMGFYESSLAMALGYFIHVYLQDNSIGFVTGPDGMLRLEPGQVRIPDVAFFSWRHFPDRLLPAGQILDIVPDLAVEILSPSNTKAEMARKRKEYFLGDCKLVWEIDPVKKTVRVYTAPDECILIRERGTLDGGKVLPGFTLPVAQLFARAGKRSAS